MSNAQNRSYTELITLPTFIERFRYLKLDGRVGGETFGGHRWLNQRFYHSKEWLDFRDRIIIRDLGCDLAVAGYDISRGATIHHINPVTIEDVIEMNPVLFDPDNVVCVSSWTHNALHYGDETLLLTEPSVRYSGDTCPWIKTALRND